MDRSNTVVERGSCGKSKDECEYVVPLQKGDRIQEYHTNMHGCQMVRILMVSRVNNNDLNIVAALRRH